MDARLTRISIAALTVALAVATTAKAQNVYRWKDDEGKIHYSKSLPAEYAHRPYDILSPTGILLKRVTNPVESGPSKDEKEAKVKELKPLYTEAEKQIRSDRLLVLRYHSEEEIVKAMELEIDQLSYDSRILDQAQKSVLTSMHGQIQLAADRQRAGLEVEPKQKAEIDKLRKRLIENEGAVARIEVRKLQIREIFQKDLDRYRFLQDNPQG